MSKGRKAPRSQRSPSAKSSSDALIEAGSELMWHGGYGRVGVQKILARAGLPKGSFYHHFPSKERFGLAVLERYASGLREIFERQLSDGRFTPLKRVARLFEEFEGMLVEQGCQGGCLMGNLALEQSDVSEAFRLRLRSLFDEQRTLLAACLQEAKERGELHSRQEAKVLASLCLCAWQGSLMQMKLERDPAALREFRQVILKELLR